MLYATSLLGCPLEILIEEFADVFQLLGFAKGAVPATWHNDQFGSDFGGTQGVQQLAALLIWDEWILVAVYDQKRRVVAVDVGDGIGLSRQRHLLLQRTAEQLRFG